MLEFERNTAAFIEKHALIRKGDSIVAGVSGGPDSMALLDFLAKRRASYGIRVIAAHVDHMLRGEESVQDLEYVKAFCEEHGISFRATAIPIKEKMDQNKTGMQETARTYRYKFYESVMREEGANTLAIGQHGDDQIETILMRLTRGSRGKSRAGIQPCRSFAGGKVIRPLLAVTKDHIEQYCSYYHLEPRRDPSNDLPYYTRNRFRLEILPVLKKENQLIHEHFQRFSEDLLEDEEYLEELAKHEMSTVWQVESDEISIHIPSFLAVPLPLQRRGIHLILSYLYQKNVTDVTARHIDAAKRLIMGDNPSGVLHFPRGLHVIRAYNTCKFTYKRNKDVQNYCYELQDEGEIMIPSGERILLECKKGPFQVKNRPECLVLLADTIQLPLKVRTRRPGDRMRLKGMDGSKKIKDLFIDEKIPLHDRDAWPIVTDQNGKLLWVPGLKKSVYDVSPKDQRLYYVLHLITPGRQQRE